MMKQLLATDRLRAALLGAVRQAYADLRRDHAGERLYAFAIGSTPLGEFLCVAGNTEESLTRTAEDYRAAGYTARGGKDPLEVLRASLRWSSNDWSYFVCEPYFYEVNDVIRRSCLQTEEQAAQIHSICLDVLGAMHADGTFGIGPQRDGLVVNLELGAPDHTLQVEWARQVNPPAVVQRYQNELLASYHAMDQLERAADPRGETAGVAG
jgi:hypothetical protein